MLTMFEKIVLSSAYVMEKSKDVTINYEAINQLLSTKIPKGKYWGESNAFGFMDLPVNKIVNYLLLYQAIDFGFWGEKKWSIATSENTIIDGSYALMYIFIKNIDLFTDFKKLEKISFAEFQELFKGNNNLPLLKERYDIIVSVARTVNEKMNSDFYNYIKDITDDRVLMDIIINNFSTFKDERNYMGKIVYYYKLASLLVSDIMHVRNIKEGKSFDYSHIAGCTDYKIPQILRNLGLIEFSKELADLVDNKILIEEGSSYEVEIRASAIVVINYIKEKTELCGMEINDFLWLKSQSEKMKFPYHLTRTTTY